MRGNPIRGQQKWNRDGSAVFDYLSEKILSMWAWKRQDVHLLKGVAHVQYGYVLIPLTPVTSIR